MAATPWTFKGISDAERAQITRLARAAGVPISLFVVACCLRADGEPITVSVPPVPAPGAAGLPTPTDHTERLERLIRLAGEAPDTSTHRTALRALSRLIRAEIDTVLPSATVGRTAPPLPKLPAPE